MFKIDTVPGDFELGLVYSVFATMCPIAMSNQRPAGVQAPRPVPPPNTVEYWSYILRQQREDARRQQQELMGQRLHNRMRRNFPQLEQQMANMRVQE